MAVIFFITYGTLLFIMAARGTVLKFHKMSNSPVPIYYILPIIIIATNKRPLTGLGWQKLVFNSGIACPFFYPKHSRVVVKFLTYR
jgi:hypothetical protein